MRPPSRTPGCCSPSAPRSARVAGPTRGAPPRARFAAGAAAARPSSRLRAEIEVAHVAREAVEHRRARHAEVLVGRRPPRARVYAVGIATLPGPHAPLGLGGELEAE